MKFDIIKFCQDRNAANAQPVQFNSSGNDSTITKRMRYSQIVNNTRHKTMTIQSQDNYVFTRYQQFIQTRPRQYQVGKPFLY